MKAQQWHQRPVRDTSREKLSIHVHLWNTIVYKRPPLIHYAGDEVLMFDKIFIHVVMVRLICHEEAMGSFRDDTIVFFSLPTSPDWPHWFYNNYFTTRRPPYWTILADYFKPRREQNRCCVCSIINIYWSVWDIVYLWSFCLYLQSSTV